jgi:serine protease Do
MVATVPSIGANASISAALDEVTRSARESLVLISRRGGNGAGVIWTSDGRIVTNHHVVGNDREIEVVLADGRKLPGEVTARHNTRDLAIVQVNETGLAAARIGDSSTVRPGQLAIAIGHPLGFRDSVTMGIIVASGQAASDEGPRTGDFLQSDVTLAPGNSGGPLLDAEGRVIGINSMIAGRLSLAIPSQAAARFVAGNQPGLGAYIGVAGVMVLLRGASQRVGFLLNDIVDGGPADRAGLIVGDIIVAIGEAPVIDQESIPAAMLRLVPGDAVTISVLRGGEPRAFVVVPTERA